MVERTIGAGTRGPWVLSLALFIFIGLTMDKPGSHLQVSLLRVEWAGSITAPLRSFSGQEVGVTNLVGDGR